MSPSEFEARTHALAGALHARGECLAAAESCTGGWIAKLCTDQPGSSAWFERGLVTYSNAAKTDMLAVPAALIERHGAVSGEVTGAMAAGALGASNADWSVSVSGIAGPDGGSDDKPVGTVWFGWCERGCSPETACHVFDGNRDAVRARSVIAALDGLLARIDADG